MKEKPSSNKLIIFGIILIVILGLIAYNVKKSKEVDYANMTQEEFVAATQEKINTIAKKDLSGLGERDRMEYYVSTFMTAIENGNYENAYGMLYDDFKTNYFSTLESFQTYAQTKFPKMVSLNHTNIERIGDIYVLWVELSSSLSSKDSAIEMKFVVKENDLNDFVLSFSVI